MKYSVNFPYKSPIPHGSVNNYWREITAWIEENKTGNWGWSRRTPGCPDLGGYFTFDNEEDRVKFILRWL